MEKRLHVLSWININFKCIDINMVGFESINKPEIYW